MDEREDGRGRADAEHEGEDGGGGEYRSFAEAAYGLAHILHQRFDKGQSALFTVGLFHGFHCSEFQDCLTPGFGWGETVSNVVRRQEAEVFFDLSSQAFFVLSRGGPGEQAAAPTAEGSHFRSSAFTAKKRLMMAAVCSQSF